jgi:hypothetical protein
VSWRKKIDAATEKIDSHRHWKGFNPTEIKVRGSVKKENFKGSIIMGLSCWDRFELNGIKLNWTGKNISIIIRSHRNWNSLSSIMSTANCRHPVRNVKFKLPEKLPPSSLFALSIFIMPCSWIISYDDCSWFSSQNPDLSLSWVPQSDTESIDNFSSFVDFCIFIFYPFYYTPNKF